MAKLLCLSKRVRPECLAAVTFLTTRVHEVEENDMGKLRRLLGYLRATQNRGITLCIDDNMTVCAYIICPMGCIHATGSLIPAVLLSSTMR